MGRAAGRGAHRRRFDDALKIVVDGNYCVKCHMVADYRAAGSNRAKAPNLADVYRRLRPDYTRGWIANPKMILPYTSMPVNIEVRSGGAAFLGGVSQDLYHGTSIEQVDALVDLLMNFDPFSRRAAGSPKWSSLRPFLRTALHQPRGASTATPAAAGDSPTLEFGE